MAPIPGFPSAIAPPALARAASLIAEREAVWLDISTASTTKLLDRLERGGHITRDSHPSDRRALVISVTPETHRSAMSTVGRQQARRFNAAARLSPSEREVVIGFLTDMADELSLAHAPWAAGPPA